MTVTTTHTLKIYSGDGATTAFAIDFQFFASTDIVEEILSSAGSDITSSYTFAYTGGTDSDGLPATGSCTISPAPEDESTITFNRETSAVQSTTYTEGNAFPAKTVEALADRTVLLAQEAKYNADLASFTVQGNWVTATAYAVKALVKSTGGSYVCTVAHTSGSSTEPGVGADWTDNWVLLAADGTDAFDWNGQWLTATAYALDDAVFNDGSAYICTTAHTSSASDEPGTGGSWTTYWDLFAQQGLTGAGTGDLLAANNLGDVSNAATSRVNLGVVIGTDVQAHGDVLDDLNTTGAVGADSEFLVGTGAGAMAWEDAATARTSLGLGSAALLAETTTAEYRSNTADRALSTDQVWAAMAEVTLTDGANIAVDMSTFMDAVVTLGGNRTLDNPTNTKVGQKGRIRVVQDGTGSRTLSYGSNYEFAGGTAPTLTTTASAEDFLDYDVISATRIRLSFSGDWS